MSFNELELNVESVVLSCVKWSRYAYNIKLSSVQSSDRGVFYLSDSDTDAQAVVIQEPTRTIVAFRGSTTPTDWMHDFKIWRKRVKYLNNAWVHTGFVQQYEALREGILGKIQGNKPVICCGHSLGGALSTIAALDLSLKRMHVTCCTFGSPRVGSAYFRRLFDKHVKTSTRCVFKNDPITFTPFPLRFSHVGGVCYFDDVGLYTHNKQKCRCLLGCSPGHHSLDNYLSAVS